MNKEVMHIRAAGRWQDVLHYADGRVVKTGWKHNQIQINAAALVASLLKSQHVADAAFLGLRYLAIGSGLAGWDSSPPAQPNTDTTLVTEYARKLVDVADTKWMTDFTSNSGIESATPTNVIAISATLGTGDANGSMREFGLFGGEATATFDSGLMFNWVIHQKVDKDSSLTIVRTIEIKISEP